MAGSRPYIYRGQDFSLQRDKNRFVLPTLFRNTVRESSNGQPVLSLIKHHRWNCLMGFGLSRVDEFPQMLEEERQRAKDAGESYDHDTRLMQVYGVVDVPFDGSGRFVLPDHIATIANIGKEIYYQGAGEYLTLWSPEELAKAGPGLEMAQAACASLAAKERAKAKRA
jgi:MraZ protein